MAVVFEPFVNKKENKSLHKYAGVNRKDIQSGISIPHLSLFHEKYVYGQNIRQVFTNAICVMVMNNNLTV